MVTTVAEASRCPTSEYAAPPAWQDGFLSVLPEIERRLRFAFRELFAEAKEEAVQEATCLACRAYARLAADGRAGVATGASLAGYAAAQYRAGRRAVAPLNVRDVCSAHCRLRKGVTVERLDVACDGGWREVLVEDRTVTPADLAASRIDYPAFLAALPPRTRRVADALAGGETTGEAAARFDLSAARVSQLRRELRLAWRRFHGEDDETAARPAGTASAFVHDADGTVRCVYAEAVDLPAPGRPEIRRASHVEPTSDGRRTADLSPVGGPTLGPFARRGEARSAELEWLDRHRLAGGGT